MAVQRDNIGAQKSVNVNVKLRNQDWVVEQTRNGAHLNADVNALLLRHATDTQPSHLIPVIVNARHYHQDHYLHANTWTRQHVHMNAKNNHQLVDAKLQRVNTGHGIGINAHVFAPSQPQLHLTRIWYGRQLHVIGNVTTIRPAQLTNNGTEMNASARLVLNVKH